MPSSACETAFQALGLASDNDYAALKKLLSRTPAAWKSEVFHEVLGVANLSRACLDVLFRHGLTTSTLLSVRAAPPLIHCTNVDNLELVRYLVEQRKADLEGRDGDGMTALMHAASGRRVDVVQYLLDRGADINAVDSKGKSPLYLAARFGRVDTVRLLLDRGASEGLWPAICGAAEKGHTAIIELLLSRGRDVNATDPNGLNALDWAIHKGHTETVSFLLDRGAIFRTHHGEAVVPFLSAAYEGYTAVLRLLLDRGLPVLSIRNEEGFTCLHRAAHGNQVETLGFLLDRGMELDVGAYDSSMPLHDAVVSGAVECVRLLLERGASLEASKTIWEDNRTTMTPLIAAAISCMNPFESFNPDSPPAVFKLLLDHIDRSEDPGRLLLMPSAAGWTALSICNQGDVTFELRARAELLLPHLRMIPAEGPIGSLEGFDPTTFEFYSLARLLDVLNDRKKTALSPVQWSSALVRLLDLFPSDLQPFGSEYGAVYVEALAYQTKELRRQLHSFLPSQCGRDWTVNRLAWFKAGRVVQRGMEAVLGRATGRTSWRGTDLL